MAIPSVAAANSGDSYTQLAEWQLSNGDTTPPPLSEPPSDMKAFVADASATLQDAEAIARAAVLAGRG